LLEQLQLLAGDRCDYCRIPAAFDPLPFQVDHIRVLAINDPDAVAFRAELMDEGLFF
jgi:hypothetical protein